MSEAEQRKREEAQRRSLRWAWLGWKGATTAAQEEKRKEEVLDVFRALVEDSKRGVKAREFIVRWGAVVVTGRREGLSTESRRAESKGA